MLKPIANLIDRTHCEPFLRTFGINEEQEQPERQLVCRKLLQTLSIGASCQILARYSTEYAAYGREVPADIQAPLNLFFRRRSILKLLRRLTMGYALPGTPLDINQKTKVLWQSALHKGKYGSSIVWFLNLPQYNNGYRVRY